MTHPLAGRKQSAEHIAKRVASIRKTQSEWPPERMNEYMAKLRDKEVRAKSVATRRAAGSYKLTPELLASSKSRIGVPLSEETRRKQSIAMQGKKNALGTKRDMEFRRKLSEYWAANREKHNNYKDGKCGERQFMRQLDMSRLDYRLWREGVMERDNWTCVSCGVRGGELHADHIKSYSEYPELRLELSNGRTLCAPCHRKTENYGGRKAKKESV